MYIKEVLPDWSSSAISSLSHTDRVECGRDPVLSALCEKHKEDFDVLEQTGHIREKN